MPDPNELDKFLGNLSPGTQPFDAQPAPAPEKPADEEPAPAPATVVDGGAPPEEPHKNRRHRRWEAQLAEREAELREREAYLRAREDLKGEVGPTDVDPRLLRLYGDSETGRLAAQLTAEVLADATKQAEDRAYARFAQEREAALAEERQSEAFIDNQLENLEDGTGIDLTSNAPAARKARREFLELVEKLSPKDDEGNITEYADFESTFELYQSRGTQNSAARNKQLASPGMQKPTASEGTQAQAEQDKTRDWLRSVGIKV